MVLRAVTWDMFHLSMLGAGCACSTCVAVQGRARRELELIPRCSFAGGTLAFATGSGFTATGGCHFVPKVPAPADDRGSFGLRTSVLPPSPHPLSKAMFPLAQHIQWFGVN